jgi:hypothetical protein
VNLSRNEITILFFIKTDTDEAPMKSGEQNLQKPILKKKLNNVEIIKESIEVFIYCQ